MALKAVKPIKPIICSITLSQGAVRYKTLWKPRHCDVVTRDGDDVTMVMEYYAVRETGMGVEMERAVAMQLKKGQTINDVKVQDL